MATADDIMPPHSGRAEKALVEGVIQAFGFEIAVRDIWTPERAPESVLPWLAWALSVDDWDEAWSPDRKRAVIAASVEVHRHKGTVASVKAALAAMGYGGAEVVETAVDTPRYGSGRAYGDGVTYGSLGASWADYWVNLTQAVSARDAARIAARLRSVAPARCRLRAVTIPGIYRVYGDGVRYGDDATYGGIYAFGE